MGILHLYFLSCCSARRKNKTRSQTRLPAITTPASTTENTPLISEAARREALIRYYTAEGICVSSHRPPHRRSRSQPILSTNDINYRADLMSHVSSYEEPTPSTYTRSPKLSTAEYYAWINGRLDDLVAREIPQVGSSTSYSGTVWEGEEARREEEDRQQALLRAREKPSVLTITQTRETSAQDEVGDFTPTPSTAVASSILSFGTYRNYQTWVSRLPDLQIPEGMAFEFDFESEVSGVSLGDEGAGSEIEYPL